LSQPVVAELPGEKWQVISESFLPELLAGKPAGRQVVVAHLASAAGTPAVIIFGSSSSVHWRPWRVEHRVVQNDFPCNPCKGDRCYAFDEPRCILSVTFEQVRDACETLLAETDRGDRANSVAPLKIEGLRTN